MNFFAQQDRARRNTFWLILLMIGAVVCLITMTALALSLIMHFAQQPSSDATQADWQTGLLASDIIYWATSGVLIVVVSGSLFKLIQLGGSGQRVAEALGGRLINFDTRDGDEKKVLNVVEEMAIASGSSVPPVYVMDELSINAFAAGTDRRNAVIGVTRGCIQLLSRDELQGVIAHEFSHIHHGDMKINLRLVAILHGILLIGLVGGLILRGSAISRNRKSNGAQIGAGIALLILGYCGVFFGNIIKAAVSRQREFLADASAVKFTRNPSGIANALKKIGGASGHSIITAPRAQEYSHFYFGQGVKHAFGSLMATHPPLEERIKRIQPNWDGKLITPSKDSQSNTAEATKTEKKPESTTASAMAMGLAAIDNIGNPTPDNLSAAQNFIETLPSTLKDAAHDPFSARALIYCLLIDSESNKYQQKQIDLLKKQAHPATYKAFSKLNDEVKNLSRSQHLPLLELAMPAIKMQSKPQYGVFKKNLIGLIKANNEVSLFEWCLYRIVTQGYGGVSRSGNVNISKLSPQIHTVLAAVCYGGKTEDTTKALHAAAKHLPQVEWQKGISNTSKTVSSFQELDAALDQLALLRPLDKPKFLKALAACIESDNVITPEEAELFRAIADCLDCPVPFPVSSA